MTWRAFLKKWPRWDSRCPWSPPSVWRSPSCVRPDGQRLGHHDDHDRSHDYGRAGHDDDHDDHRAADHHHDDDHDDVANPHLDLTGHQDDHPPHSVELGFAASRHTARRSGRFRCTNDCRSPTAGATWH